MERPNIGRALLGGLVATAVMTVIMYGAPMPKTDVADMLGKFISEKLSNPNLEPLGGAWCVGMGVHNVRTLLIFIQPRRN